MSIVTRCGAVSLLLGLLAGALPAAAQTNPADSAGSSWTDPPVRGSAGPEVAAAVKPTEARPEPETRAVTETKPSRRATSSSDAKAERTAAPTPAEKAAVTLGVKPVEARGRMTASEPRTRRDVVRPRMVERPLVVARRPGRLVERSARRPPLRGYAYAPEPRVDGRGDTASWPRRRMAGWSGLIEERRASRFARARASGYLVMRMRTYAYPDGTFERHLMPYDGGELD